MSPKMRLLGKKRHHHLIHLIQTSPLAATNFMQNNDLHPSSTMNNNDTIAHLAIRHDQSGQFLQKMIEIWPDFNPGTHCDKEGKTLWHEAAQCNHLEAIKTLLEHPNFHKSQIDCLKRGDWTALMLATAKSGTSALTQLLLSAGADVNLRNKDGWTPFHIACRTGDICTLNALMSHKSIVTNTRSNNGRTPLHTAALAGNTEVVELVRERFELDECDCTGNTPIMDAVKAGNTDIIRQLVDQGHSISKRDHLGRNCLHVAAMMGNVGLINVLVKEFNLSLMDVDNSGMSSLHLAAFEDQLDVVHFIVGLEGREVILKEDFNGRSVLDVAKERTREYLLQTGTQQ